MANGVEDHDMLFIRNNGNPAKQSTVRSWTKQMSDFLNIPIYSHGFRQRCVTFLSQKGIPKDLIQHLLNWKSSEMVAVYDDTEIIDKNFDELDALR